VSEILVASIIITILASLVSYIVSTLRRVLKRRVAKTKIRPIREYAEDSEFPHARYKFRRKVTEPKKSEDLTKRPYYITLLLLIFVFVTLWVFYMGDGMEGAKIAWAFGGPILGAITGFWLSSKTGSTD
jgi:preprotein translocase subunit SecY